MDNHQQPDIKCSSCGIVGPTTLFVKNKRCSFGVEKTCRACKQKVQNKYHAKKYQETGSWAYAKNPEQHQSYCRSWAAANRHVINRLAATRRSSTPIWEDVEQLNEFYKNCPIGYEVDHIIPVNNPQVCGLTTLSNLQYLPRRVNRQKGNYFHADEQSDADDYAGQSSTTGY